MDSIFRGRLIRESDLYASIYGTCKSINLKRMTLKRGLQLLGPADFDTVCQDFNTASNLSLVV